MIMLDDFHGRFSGHHPTPPAPEPPPPPITAIDGLIIAEATVDQLESALKKRISALLKANSGLSELRTASGAAQSAHSLAVEETKKLVLPQTTSDKDELSLFFNRHEELQCAALSTDAAKSRAELAVATATQEVGTMADQLARTCQAMSARSELVSSPVVLAALHLASRSAQRKQALPEAKAEPAEPTVEQAKLASDLKDSTLQLMVTMARAKELAARLRTFSDWLDKCKDGDGIVEPVRPNEEEVQRYLVQLEARMTERQLSHRQGALLFKEQKDLFAQCLEANQAVVALLEAFDSQSLIAPDKLRTAAILAASARGNFDSVARELKNATSDVDKLKGSLDTLERVTASKKEEEQIEVLRKAMHDLAQSFGRLNEAKTAERITKNMAEVSVPRLGIGASLDLQEALAWLAKNDLDQQGASRQNYSRATKLELLQESVAAYSKEVKSIKTALQRLNVSLLPKRNERPCDLLRALINAAAWMYRGLEEEEAVFPVY